MKRRRRPKGLGKSDPLPAGDYQYLGDLLRRLSTQVGDLGWLLQKNMTVGELRHHETRFAELFVTATALRARFENLTLRRGGPLPAGMDLEEKMALLLDLHGLDLTQLEVWLEKCRQEAVVADLKRPQGARKT